MVPAVVEVCRPQPAHSQVHGLASSFQLPALQAAAGWAHEAIRPPLVRQPFGACGIIRERRHELL
jgi:hypothetical protein